MALEFTAEIKEGVIHVKPIIEKIGNDVIVHVPSFKLMEELKHKHKDYKRGKRDIQSV